METMALIKQRQSAREQHDPSEAEVAPIALFLASSLNVELVYIILKSVTQFAYVIPAQLSNQNTNNRVATKKVASMDLEMLDGNCTLHMH